MQRGTAKTTGMTISFVIPEASAPRVGKDLNDRSVYSTIVEGEAGFKVGKGGGNTTIILTGYH